MARQTEVARRPTVQQTVEFYKKAGKNMGAIKYVENSIAVLTRVSAV
jgi:hypothetical protein